MEKLSSALRTLAVIGAVLIAGWWTILLRSKLNEHKAALRDRDERIEDLGLEIQQKDARIGELGVEIEKKKKRITELEAALALLKVDHRLVRIEVLGQEPGADGGLRTKLRFTELDSRGLPFGPGRELEVAGRRVYVESLVVKFDDAYVEGGDFLRGTSICLFRRAFGEEQKPMEGAPLDLDGQRPRVYAGDHLPQPFYDDLWTRFWDYANNPEKAAERGVRAIHGEAPFMDVLPGRSYVVELRASGGLAIRAE